MNTHPVWSSAAGSESSQWLSSWSRARRVMVTLDNVANEDAGLEA